jgi:predicted nuclease of predicted toxin-antitoxin system
VKVLIDECLPRYLKGVLIGHVSQTVRHAGWSGIKNGELLALAEAEFDVFLTADQNLRYQQNLSKRKIAIIELPTNTLSLVKILLPEILNKLTTIEPGDYVQIKNNRLRA